MSLSAVTAPTDKGVVPGVQNSMAAVPSPSGDEMDISPPARDAAPSEAPQSRPMSTTASNSPDRPTLDHTDPGAAAPYGTRSRNRNSSARPNYADDKEIDLEIEAAGKYAKNGKKSTATVAAPSNVPSESTSSNTGGFAAVNAVTQPANGATSTPPVASVGSGNYNLVPPPQPSKKRKSPGSSTVVATAPVNTSTTRTKSFAPPRARSYVETNMLSFEQCGARLNNKRQLVADDGTSLQANEHAYFICEPPGEPYYLARIMEFLHADNDPNAPVDAVRVNWYYRPKDIQRRVQDTRVVFASMHSDTCPLTSFRGKCNIQHLSNIENLDDYRTQKDCFWFDKLYDRYMHRYYEVIPTGKVVNVAPHVKKVLDERWEFVLVEVGRARDLTSESKKCKRCMGFAANHDSVDCAVCKFTYHMACVKPPLLKKPARGFAWACAVCSRAQERALQIKNTPNPAQSSNSLEDDLLDEEDDSPVGADQITRESSVGLEPHPPPTAAQIAQASLWPYRYLGIHSKPEDALDYDDRIYPRASSRLGPRHQANVMVWHGQPVELVKPAEGKKKYKPTGGKKEGKAATADTDKDKRQKRPKWVVDEPPGYVARGFDEPVEIRGKKEHTAQVIFKLPEVSGVSERGLDGDDEPPADYGKVVDEYMEKVKSIAVQYDVKPESTDLLTKALEKLQEHKYNSEKALEAMRHLHRRNDLKQPDLNKEEQKRFEEGVAKFGSELHLVAKHVSPTIKEGRIVRYYYMWKKTDKGRQIWGNYEGRKSKKESRRIEKDGSTKLLDDVADDQDDSAFDNEKAIQKKRGFLCKFCDTRSSRQWRRAPATAPGTLVPSDPTAKNAKDKSSWLTLALCGKCAYLWRRYAIQYESIEEVAKKIAASGGRASKRRVDEELMRTVIEAQSAAGDLITRNVAQMATSAGVEVPPTMVQTDEPPKKKPKSDKDGKASTPEVIPEKKKPVEPEPLEPEPPRVKVHPCAVCHAIDVPHDKLLKCRDCRMHVHGTCYGVGSGPHPNSWFCDTCRNDHTTQVSTTYECVLCPIKCTPQELMEPPRISHKKKTDREREKERLEREIVQEAGRRWRQDQEAAGRPVNPREALKRTAWNNWVHVVCALWTKEIKFGNADLLDAAEGVGFIPKERYDQPCTICTETGLPTVNCQLASCNASFHIGCAHQAEYVFGFDVAPVKSSRRDSVAVMKLDQEVGSVTPAIWCSKHVPAIPSIVHSMIEITPAGTTAMQEYARRYKQVDTSITGTVRRAAQFSYNNTTAPAVQPPNRRVSAINGTLNPISPIDRTANQSFRSSPSPMSPTTADGEAGQPNDRLRSGSTVRKCCSCLTEASPKWWLVEPLSKTSDIPMTNGILQGREPADVHTNGSSSGARSSINGLVKAEPSDAVPVAVPLVQEGIRYQCHKCHVQKKTPPSSPSQVRPRERPQPEPVQEPVIFQQTYPPPPPPHGPYPPARPPYEVHPRPGPNGQIPPHAPWSALPPWPAPPLRNGNHAPPPGPPANYNIPQQPYRPGLPPNGPDYTHAYARPPPPTGPYGTVPPPPMPNPGPATNGIAQHSSPPAHYGVPPPGSQTARAPSPRSYATANDRSVLTSPQSGLGTSILSRPFAPPDLSRPRMIESPSTTYAQRPYQQSLPPPAAGGISRAPSGQGLVQIAQAASEQAGQGTPVQPSRQVGTDTLGTPRSGVRASATSHSPNQRAAAPAESTQNQGATGDSRRSVGPGASASPSLRNLLS